ncbi:MAG: glycerophosphodiester phosphodiesterase [Bacteroidetes bacterium]|jgi:glycerophosphoryl diester phosphodiesterase|nr:glycerophosphodiester phosphodiesterase [Bacteroidota bacterium]
MLFNTKKTLIIGHRGCRGLMPENTVPSFIKAIQLQVDAIELDVVITHDKKVLISHEPWLNHQICYDENGNELTEAQAEKVNLYLLDYEKIKKFDCGTKAHPEFAEQQKLKAEKPLLDEMIIQVKNYCKQHQLNMPFFCIEIKSDETLYGISQPEPDEFVALVMQVLKQHLNASQYLIQSFDLNILKAVDQKFPEVVLSALNETIEDASAFFTKLGFHTPCYSPYFGFINDEMMQYCKERKMEVLAWTVNNESEARKLKAIGVKGIITDYPDRIG